MHKGMTLGTFLSPALGVCRHSFTRAFVLMGLSDVSLTDNRLRALIVVILAPGILHCRGYSDQNMMTEFTIAALTAVQMPFKTEHIP